MPATVYHALQAVGGLRRGRSNAKEGEPVKPVPEAHVEGVLPLVSPQVKAMIELQMLTGMRPGEICIMRGCDLDATGNVWTYTPSTHKTEHHGIERPIYLGPKAIEVVKKLLKPETQAFLFDPREAEGERNVKKKAARKTPMTPSQAARKRKSKPKVTPQNHYTTESYRRAIIVVARLPLPVSLVHLATTYWGQKKSAEAILLLQLAAHPQGTGPSDPDPDLAVLCPWLLGMGRYQLVDQHLAPSLALTSYQAAPLPPMWRVILGASAVL